jgi:hypothetical protein
LAAAFGFAAAFGLAAGFALAFGASAASDASAAAGAGFGLFSRAGLEGFAPSVRISVIRSSVNS